MVHIRAVKMTSGLCGSDMYVIRDNSYASKCTRITYCHEIILGVVDNYLIPRNHICGPTYLL